MPWSTWKYENGDRMLLTEPLRGSVSSEYRKISQQRISILYVKTHVYAKNMKLFILTMTLLLAGISTTVNADPRNGFAANGPPAQQRPQISASEAAARVQAREGGKILAVETINGGAAYRVKILNRKGQVRAIVVNANPR